MAEKRKPGMWTYVEGNLAKYGGLVIGIGSAARFDNLGHAAVGVAIGGVFYFLGSIYRDAAVEADIEEIVGKSRPKKEGELEQGARG